MNYKLFLTIKSYNDKISNTIIYKLSLTIDNNKITKYIIKKVKKINLGLNKYQYINKKIEKRNKYNSDILIDIIAIGPEITNTLINTSINWFAYLEFRLNEGNNDVVKNNINIIADIVFKILKKNKILFIDNLMNNTNIDGQKEYIKLVLENSIKNKSFTCKE